MTYDVDWIIFFFVLFCLTARIPKSRYFRYPNNAAERVIFGCNEYEHIEQSESDSRVDIEFDSFQNKRHYFSLPSDSVIFIVHWRDTLMKFSAEFFWCHQVWTVLELPASALLFIIEFAVVLGSAGITGDAGRATSEYDRIFFRYSHNGRWLISQHFEIEPPVLGSEIWFNFWFSPFLAILCL